MISIADIQGALAQHSVTVGDGDHSVGAKATHVDAHPQALPAGVLVPLVERGDSGLHVILTQRSNELRQHAGQVSFPGGRHDADDEDLIVTALREAEEEIGLRRQDVTVLGELNRYRTGTGFQITPIVGHVPGHFEAAPEPGEVAAVFEVPFELIMDDKTFELRTAVWKGKTREFYALDYGNRYIWGATAGILVGMSRIMRTYLGRNNT